MNIILLITLLCTEFVIFLFHFCISYCSGVILHASTSCSKYDHEFMRISLFADECASGNV